MSKWPCDSVFINQFNEFVNTKVLEDVYLGYTSSELRIFQFLGQKFKKVVELLLANIQNV